MRSHLRHHPIVLLAALTLSATSWACDGSEGTDGPAASAVDKASADDKASKEESAAKPASSAPGSDPDKAKPSAVKSSASDDDSGKADPASQATATLPPPPAGPAMSGHLATAQGQVPLKPWEVETLAAAQARAGGLGVFFPEARWTDRAAAVMALVDNMEPEGVRESRLPDGLVDSVVELRAALLENPGWTGDMVTDNSRALRIAKGEFQMVQLWQAAVRAMRHDDSGLLPWSRRETARRILVGLLIWEPPSALVATLRPPTDQYEALMKSLKRYRKLAKKGFTPIPKSIRQARPHREHDAIPILRKRLVEEGALLGDLESRKWDQELTDALRTEREARQLTGYKKWRRNIDRYIVRDLNITAQDRVKQVELNLERWRVSHFNHYTYKVFINLPDFHGEVWDGPERLSRFKTVVGNNKVKSGRRINATPVLTARIKRLVYNPTWTVPSRIIHQELVPQAQKKVDKAGEGQTALDYLRAKGYRVWNEDKPHKMRLRRAPGPDNALGKVKFQFDNRYFVFLHDTNLKSKFGRKRRAMSHGCMRIHKPLDLAKLLLERDGSYWKVKKLRVMNHYKETPIYLKETVPLVVDYITARVDSDGRTRFMWDMYRHDAPRIAAK